MNSDPFVLTAAPDPALFPGGHLYREISAVGGTCRVQQKGRKGRYLGSTPRIITLPPTVEGATLAGSLIKRGVATLSRPWINLSGAVLHAFEVAKDSDEA